MSNSEVRTFPVSRIATVDICAIGVRKHHISAFVEVDVTTLREKIILARKQHRRVSFTACLLKAIALSVSQFEESAAYLKGKRSMVIFKNVNISLLVERAVNGTKVPLPVLITNVNNLTAEAISLEIAQAQAAETRAGKAVINRNISFAERVYYYFPGFLRRWFWKMLLRFPNATYQKMGNVAVTSTGMMGQISGWFVPISIHPLCIGTGSVVKKAVVVNDCIVIREILHLTVLMDHDVIDGAQMARFIQYLTSIIKNGQCIDS